MAHPGKLSPLDLQVLKNALTLCWEYGKEVPTQIGQSCFHQGLDTAEILMKLELDVATMAASVVYFPAQFGKLSQETIQKRLGQEIAELVGGLKYIAVAHTRHAEGLASLDNASQRDNLRRMLLAVVEDVRVVLIKLAEQLSTLRGFKALSKEDAAQVALTTKDIYAPLANRLGIGQIKWELEDLAFRILEPTAYQHIKKLLAQKRLSREGYINDVIQIISDALEKESIKADITGRVKHIYSIWRKMVSKNIDFQDIYDVRAVRILVPEIRDCYAALGVVHSLWQHVPKEFDDYIATPKDNGYRSLHTAVIGPQGATLEIQIRTFEMHEQAELGVAAHWVYKEGGKEVSAYQQKMTAIRQILDWNQQISEDDDSVQTLYSEIFEDMVYVFTPMGEVVELPKGSTPLDFAYHVHSEVGHRCRGAKVNGVMTHLNTPLKSGDQVHIFTAKEGGPSRDWLNPDYGYIRSSRARAKVHAWFRHQNKDQHIQQGREMLDRELKRLRLEKFNLSQILPKFKRYNSIDELLAAFGGGDLRVAQILNAIQAEAPLPEKTKVRVKTPSARVSKQDVKIAGVGDLLCYFAKCCKPLPGDPIIGYITLGRGVSIHRKDCLNILGRNTQKKRLIEISWGGTTHNVYPVDIKISAYDRQGLLRDITTILSADKVNVISVNSRTNPQNNVATIILTLEISNLGVLGHVMNKIQQLPNVLEVERAQESY
ncbi:MAG TPA: GTP diphosphokinase [Gammaproteobacteria bacterium]|nr:GTP diphosphokinase [Gammaproteobacteria bacterium]